MEKPIGENTLRMVAVTALVLIVSSQGGARSASQQTGGADAVTADAFDRWMTEFSNWGRWGSDDELGTLNLITDEKRTQAASLVQTGVTVSLSRPLRLGQRATFQRGFNNIFAYGGPGLGERAQWIEEQHQIGYHGSPLTHLDALCHVAWDGLTYNGRAFETMATETDGCTANGVAPLRDGIITRGLLMDLPGADRVQVEDIESWEQRTGISISQGDALLLRTAGSGGFHNSIMPFIRHRDIAMLIADGGVVDGGPVEDRTTLPMHMFTLVALGMPLIDGVDLEALADVATRLNRWEFMFTVAPLPVDNGAGSAVNPLAIF